eukprot:9665304-Prorocentrum_lima.AAC.1
MRISQRGPRGLKATKGKDQRLIKKADLTLWKQRPRFSTIEKARDNERMNQRNTSHRSETRIPEAGTSSKNRPTSRGRAEEDLTPE